MTRKVLSNMLVLFIVVGVLSACTMSLNGGVPTPVRSDSTQAVLTVMAQLTPSPEVVVVVTQTANVDQAAKSPGGEAAPAKPTAVPSATPQPAAAVATATATVQAPAPAQPTNTSQPESQPESSPTLAPTTAAPTITKTLPPSPTFALDDVRSKLGVPTWRDTFDGSQFWYVYQDERIKFESKDGKLVMTAFSSKLPGGWALVPLEVSTKFYVELDGTFGSACKGRDRFGLIISPNNRANKGYLFDISCEGKYSLWTWDGIEEQALSLVGWTPDRTILAGPKQKNRVGVLVDGNHLYLYVNGKKLTDVVDKTMDKMYFGVFVDANETDNFTVTSDELNYWVVP